MEIHINASHTVFLLYPILEEHRYCATSPIHIFLPYVHVHLLFPLLICKWEIFGMDLLVIASPNLSSTSTHSYNFVVLAEHVVCNELDSVR